MQAITDSLSRKIVIVVTLFFNRSVPQLKFTTFLSVKMVWGYSSAGRAPALQAGGRRFDPDYLHQKDRSLKAFENR